MNRKTSSRKYLPTAGPRRSHLDTIPDSGRAKLLFCPDRSAGKQSGASDRTSKKIASLFFAEVWASQQRRPTWWAVSRCVRSRRSSAFAIAALVAATAFSSLAQSTNTMRSNNTLDFASFQIISQRNIFDPNRTARSRSNSTRAEERGADSFSFVGMMSYAKGDFAFFDGTSSEYRKVLKPDGEIANFKVTALNPKSVTLSAGTNEIVLKVGMQMRRDADAHWTVATGPASYGRQNNNPARAGDSTTVAVADNPQPDDSSTNAPDDVAGPGNDNNAPEASAAPGGGGANDPLAQMMRRRALEEQQLGQGPEQ